MDNKIKHLKDWDKLSNMDEIQRNLIRASLYLFSYELLKNTVIDKIKNFFFEDSETYNIEVLNKKIDGKQNVFLSSLNWLQKIGAITKDDILGIRSIRESRNIIAHEIDKILIDSDFNIDKKQEQEIFEYIRKIERWWIIEFEVLTNSNFDGEEIKHENVISSKERLYSYIKSIGDELLNKTQDSTRETKDL